MFYIEVSYIYIIRIILVVQLNDSEFTGYHVQKNVIMFVKAVHLKVSLKAYLQI